MFFHLNLSLTYLRPCFDKPGFKSTIPVAINVKPGVRQGNIVRDYAPPPTGFHPRTELLIPTVT